MIRWIDSARLRPEQDVVRAVTLRGGYGGREVGVAEGLEGTEEGGVLGEGLFDHGMAWAAGRI